MSTFFVTWEIDVESNNHRNAALEALEIMKDPGSAVVFSVTDLSTNISRVIDLLYDDNINNDNEETKEE